MVTSSGDVEISDPANLNGNALSYNSLNQTVTVPMSSSKAFKLVMDTNTSLTGNITATLSSIQGASLPAGNSVSLLAPVTGSALLTVPSGRLNVVFNSNISSSTV